MEIKSEFISNVPRYLKIKKVVGKHLFIRYNISRGRKNLCLYFLDEKEMYLSFLRQQRCLSALLFLVSSL